jgi:serine/threonine protein kinase
MRNYSREPSKTYLKSLSPARPLSLPRQPEKVVKANEVQVGRYKYNSEEVLGKGFTSRVFKGVELDNVYKRYAIKVIELKKFRGSSLEMLEAEIEIHRQLVHENVLRLYEIIKTPYFYYLVLEYCPHGSLHEYIRQKKRLTELNAVEIMKQVLDGYNYLSSQNIMHRDLKPANILRIGKRTAI